MHLVYFVLGMIRDVLVFLIISSCLPFGWADPVKWISCPKNASSPLIVNVPKDGRIGIRSYDWPNSMKMVGSAEPRFGDCAFQFQNAQNQQLVITFLNAHVGVIFDGSGAVVLLDTTGDEIKRYATRKGSLSAYFGKDSFVGLPERWIGFEAIVAAVDERSDAPITACPFETTTTSTVVPDAPVFMALSWITHATDDDYKTCFWSYAPAKGQILKVFVRFADFHNTYERFELLADGETIILSGPGTMNLPETAVYATNSVTLLFKPGKDAKTVGKANQMFAVVSAFDSDTCEKASKSDSDPYCPKNFFETLGDTSKWYFIRNNADLKTIPYVTPYADCQSCAWSLTPAPGKELRIYPAIMDVEGSCDTAILDFSPLWRPSLDLSSPGTYSIRSVWPVRQSENASFHFNADGNYGRYGFELEISVTECDCGGAEVKLLDDQKSQKFGPSKSKEYCSNMSCQWKVSSPPQTFIGLSLSGDLRGCAINRSLEDELRIIATATGTDLLNEDNCELGLLKETAYFFTNDLSVSFNSSGDVPGTIDEDTGFGLTATAHNYSVFQNTPRVLDDPSEFIFFDTDNLADVFSAQTFQLGANLTQRQLQIYILPSRTDPDNTVVIMVDGFTDSLHPGSKEGQNPFLSKTGVITVARVARRDPSRGHSSAKLLIKVYEDEYAPLHIDTSKKGIFMPPSYLGSSKYPLETSLELLPASKNKRLNVDFNVIIGTLSPNSKIEVFSDSRLVVSLIWNNSSYTSNVKESRNVTLKCTITGESRGFFIEYEAQAVMEKGAFRASMLLTVAVLFTSILA